MMRGMVLPLSEQKGMVLSCVTTFKQASKQSGKANVRTYRGRKGTPHFLTGRSLLTLRGASQPRLLGRVFPLESSSSPHAYFAEESIRSPAQVRGKLRVNLRSQVLRIDFPQLPRCSENSSILSCVYRRSSARSL